MTIDIENEISKINEYVNLLKALQGCEITMLGVKEVGEILKCSEPTARDFMHQQGFPLVNVGTKLMVEKTAFFLFLQNRT